MKLCILKRGGTIRRGLNGEGTEFERCGRDTPTTEAVAP